MKAVVVVVACFVVCFGFAAGGCTSFGFKQGGKGTAPSELQDREKMAPIELPTSTTFCAPSFSITACSCSTASGSDSGPVFGPLSP